MQLLKHYNVNLLRTISTKSYLIEFKLNGRKPCVITKKKILNQQIESWLIIHNKSSVSSLSTCQSIISTCTKVVLFKHLLVWLNHLTILLIQVELDVKDIFQVDINNHNYNSKFHLKNIHIQGLLTMPCAILQSSQVFRAIIQSTNAVFSHR